jgi:hypothetical protein
VAAVVVALEQLALLVEQMGVLVAQGQHLALPERQ